LESETFYFLGFSGFGFYGEFVRWFIVVARFVYNMEIHLRRRSAGYG
jgi:hypothetical protein